MKKFKQLCEQMDYKTYMDISKYFVGTNLGVSVAGLLASIDNPDVVYYTAGFIAANVMAELLYVTSKGKTYTYDYAYVQKLYQEFISNYNKLNEIFGLENPVEICTMFNNVLNGGYLSKDKSFEYTTENIKSIIFMGTEIMDGTGCCRHISTLLTDILNNNGINSTTVAGLITEWHTIYETIENNKEQPQTYVEIAHSEMLDHPSYLERILGNHAITFANKDGYNYFLDPTNYCFFRYNDSQKSLVCDDYHFRIYPASSYILSGYKATNKSLKLLREHHPNIDSDTEIQMIENVEALYDDNQDVFEDFYDDNKDLCREIAEKTLALKKSVIRNKK